MRKSFSKTIPRTRSLVAATNTYTITGFLLFCPVLASLLVMFRHLFIEGRSDYKCKQLVQRLISTLHVISELKRLCYLCLAEYVQICLIISRWSDINGLSIISWRETIKKILFFWKVCFSLWGITLRIKHQPQSVYTDNHSTFVVISYWVISWLIHSGTCIQTLVKKKKGSNNMVSNTHVSSANIDTSTPSSTKSQIYIRIYI